MINNVATSDVSVDPTPIWKRKRYFMVLMIFLALFCQTSLRIALSVGIVEMTKDKPITLANGTIVHEKEFEWSSKQKGYVLSSYFYGLLATQILGGLLVKRIGAYWPYGIGVGVTSTLTLLIPVFAKIGISAVIASRVIAGLSTGSTVSCSITICTKWCPPTERTRTIMAAGAGGSVGTVVALAVSGVLASSVSWQSVFYTFGGIGIGWAVLWLILMRSSPAEDPFISKDECRYIEASLSSWNSNPSRKIPWVSILTSSAVWALIAASFADVWGFNTLTTQLPQFLHDALDFNIRNSGILSSLPYLVLAVVSQFVGVLGDYIQIKGLMTTRNMRRYFNSGAYVGIAVCLLFAAYFLSPVTTVTLIVVGVSIDSLGRIGHSVNILEIAPAFAGIISTIGFTIGTLSGIVSPILTGYIVTTPTNGEWQIIFYIASGIYVVGGIIYWIWCQTTVQPWAIQSKPEEKENKE